MSEDMTTQPQERAIENARQIALRVLATGGYGQTTVSLAQALIKVLRAQPSPREVALEKALIRAADDLTLAAGSVSGRTSIALQECAKNARRAAQKGEPG